MIPPLKSHACICVGPSPGDTACRCMLCNSTFLASSEVSPAERRFQLRQTVEWTPERLAEVQALREAGVYWRAISRELNVSIDAAESALRRHRVAA